MKSKKNTDGFFAKSDAGRSLFLLARETESSFRKMENVLQGHNPSMRRFEEKVEAWKKVDEVLKNAEAEIREALKIMNEI